MEGEICVDRCNNNTGQQRHPTRTRRQVVIACMSGDNKGPAVRDIHSNADVWWYSAGAAAVSPGSKGCRSP